MTIVWQIPNFKICHSLCCFEIQWFGRRQIIKKHICLTSRNVSKMWYSSSFFISNQDPNLPIFDTIAKKNIQYSDLIIVQRYSIFRVLDSSYNLISGSLAREYNHPKVNPGPCWWSLVWEHCNPGDQTHQERPGKLDACVFNILKTRLNQQSVKQYYRW